MQMSVMFNPSSFYGVLTPMYYTTKLLGLTPFHISSKDCRRSKLNLAWSVFFMLFVNIYAFTAVENSRADDDEFIEAVTSFLDSYLAQGGLCCGILFGCIFRNDIIQILQDIRAFDKNIQMLLHIDLKKEYRKSKNYTVVGLCLTLVIVTLALTFTTIDATYLFTFELFGEFIGYTGPFLISVFVDLQLCTLVMCLKQRFTWLNNKIVAVSKNLENHLDGCDIMVFSLTKKSQVRPTTHIVSSGYGQDKALYFIEKIRNGHYKLCTISKILNKAYSVQILFIVLQNFITIITSLYYSGRYILIKNVIPVDYLVYSGVQLSLATAQIVALVLSCSATATEASRMGMLIHRITAMNRKVENKWKEELRLEVAFFSLQLLHHNVEFTACRIFVVNETLIFSIVGAISTYLVIVIQFEVANLQRRQELQF